MKIKISRWALLAVIIFTINTVYWYCKHPDDTVGVIICSVAAIIFYIAKIGNCKNFVKSWAFFSRIQVRKILPMSIYFTNIKCYKRIENIKDI